ncbi:MAG TPA: M1 family aminopeptidase [Gemmatimonadales bacterium]|nr:M1 family aminopeptidase [Gemmatimonadales bacterium]
MMRRLAMVAVGWLAARAVAAQSNAELVGGDYYTHRRSYDLVHQRVEVGGFDWDSLAFDGRVTTTVVARERLAQVVLDMGRLLVVRRVTRPAGGRLRADHAADSLVVHLANPAGPGDTLRFTVAYRGRVRANRGLFFVQDETGQAHGPQVYSGGGTDGNLNWIPTQIAPHDKATWDVIATVPAALTVVSNGKLVSDRRHGALRTVHWSQEQPASMYLLSLVAAPVVRLRDQWRDLPVDYYVYAADTAMARSLFGFTPDILDVFERLTGVPYPWPKYAQTTIADYFGGMENVNATTLADWLPDARAEADQPWYRHVLIPHEAAHQWFGNYVTPTNWAHNWLNEGFAQYMGGQYWAERAGGPVAEDYYLDDYDLYLSVDRRRRMPLASLGSNNIYPKGSLVLRMLERELGPERFRASVHRFLTRHAFANAASDDLRRAVADATGADLRWFFDQWVYQAGHPEFTVHATWDSAAATLALAVAQIQADTLQPDSTRLRFTVPAVFRGRVALRVGTASGDVTHQAQIDRRMQTIVVPGVRSAPTMVVFDDGNRMLKTLDFEQPTSWLATQLASDADLWSRVWALQRLAGRAADPAAGAALVDVTRTANQVRLRAAAAAALAQFPAALALPALESALADTSARVREAAADALSGHADPRALALARETFVRDSSYAVRAAALSTAAGLDPAAARELVLEGLKTPSYRDVIQAAALAAAVESADSAVVLAAEAQLGDQRMVALALGAMAVQGNAAAKAALERHRHDPRPRVRRWVADALGRIAASGPRAGGGGRSSALRGAARRTRAA